MLCCPTRSHRRCVCRQVSRAPRTPVNPKSGHCDPSPTGSEDRSGPRCRRRPSAVVEERGVSSGSCSLIRRRDRRRGQAPGGQASRGMMLSDGSPEGKPGRRCPAVPVASRSATIRAGMAEGQGVGRTRGGYPAAQASQIHRGVCPRRAQRRRIGSSGTRTCRTRCSNTTGRVTPVHTRRRRHCVGSGAALRRNGSAAPLRSRWTGEKKL